MPQPSLLYAVGRLRMQSRSLLSNAQFQRLVGAADEQEALKVLHEAGYISQEQPDPERASLARQLKAYEAVRSLSPEPDTTDSFLLRNDVNNLKILLKARLLKEEPEGLSPGGTLKTEDLRHAVSEGRYTRLPEPLKQAMDTLEKRSATGLDPMEVDVLLDRALYTMMAKRLSKSSSKTARASMKMRADFANLRAFLRLRFLQAGLPLEQVLLPGGDIEAHYYLTAQQGPDILLNRFGPVYGSALRELANQALESVAGISVLEKHMEERLNNLFKPGRIAPDSLDMIIDYLLRVELESSAVRIIMAGKRNRLTTEQIEALLRSGYGK